MNRIPFRVLLSATAAETAAAALASTAGAPAAPAVEQRAAAHPRLTIDEGPFDPKNGQPVRTLKKVFIDGYDQNQPSDSQDVLRMRTTCYINGEKYFHPFIPQSTGDFAKLNALASAARTIGTIDPAIWSKNQLPPGMSV